MVDSRGFWARRSSRRQMLRGGALGLTGLSAAGLIGCSSGSRGGAPSPGAPSGAASGTAGAPAVATPKTGGRLAILSPFPEMPDYDILHQLSLQWAVPLRPAYNGVLRYNFQDPTKIEGDLAASWEVVSPTQFTIQLRPGVKWHDGTPFTARDVKASFDSMVKAGGKSAAMDYVTDTQAVNDTTVRVVTSRPRASFPHWLAWGALAIAPEKVVNADGAAGIKRTINGTGPFRLAAHQPGTSIRFTRNKDYFRPGLPYLDEVEIFWLGNAEAARSAFRSGQLMWLREQTLDDEKALAGPDVTAQVAMSASGDQLGFNSRILPGKDERVRKALHLGLNRPEAISILYREDAQIGSNIMPGTGGLTTKELQALPAFSAGTKDADRKEAQKLLSAAGLPNDPVEFIYRAGLPAQERMAQYVQSTMQPLGLKMKLVSVDAAALFAKRNSKTFQGLAGGLASFVLDATGTQGYWGPDGVEYPMDFPEVRTMLDQVESDFNRDSRQNRIRELDKKLIDLAPSVITGWTNDHDILKSNIKNFKMGPSRFLNMVYEDISLA